MHTLPVASCMSLAFLLRSTASDLCASLTLGWAGWQQEHSSQSTTDVVATPPCIFSRPHAAHLIVIEVQGLSPLKWRHIHLHCCGCGENILASG